MRQYFPDYRALMEKDRKLWEKETERMERDAEFSSKTKQQGRVVNHRVKGDLSGEFGALKMSDSDSVFKWKSAESAFSFNFEIEN